MAARKKQVDDEWELLGSPIDQLISRPFVALARANGKLALEQVKILLEVCFSKEGDTYNPVLIDMTLRRSVLVPGTDPPEMEQVVMQFQVPLITLLPIDSLLIDSADLSFGIDVTSEVDETDDDGGFFLGRLHYGPGPTETSADQGNSRSFSMNVQANQFPLPVGVSVLLQAYSNSIMPENLNKEKTR